MIFPMIKVPPVIIVSGSGWSITSHPEFSPPRFAVRLDGVRPVWAYSFESAQRRLTKLLLDQASCQVRQVASTSGGLHF